MSRRVSGIDVTKSSPFPFSNNTAMTITELINKIVLPMKFDDYLTQNQKEVIPENPEILSDCKPGATTRTVSTSQRKTFKMRLSLY